MRKKTYLVSFIATIVVLLLISFAVYSFLNMNLGIKSDVVSGIDKTKVTERFNVLLLGTDKGKMLTDTIMLVNVDPQNGKINLVSIPRDTLIKYKNRNQKINACLSLNNGKLDLLVEKIKKITDVPINYYVKIDFSGFRNVIDILGGVQIDVKTNMDYDDPAQNLHIHIKKGLQVLNGFNSEGYVRFRHTYAEGDIKRTEVQRDFLKELVRQKLQPKYITKAPELINQLYKYVESNFLVKDAAGLSSNLDKFDSETCFTSFTLSGSAQYIDEVSYYIVDESETQKLMQESFSVSDTHTVTSK